MDLVKKEKNAIQLLKDFEPKEGYWLAYSGGKDSDVIRNGKINSFASGEQWFKWWLEIDPFQLSFFD